MNCSHVFLLALAALTACRGARRLPRAEAPASLTALTWNIRYDNPGDGPDRWELRREALAAEVLRYRPALIGLQEVLAHQVAFLEGKFSGYRRVGAGRDDGLEKGEFSPLFFDTAVFRLLEGRTMWLSPTPDAPSKGWDAALPRVATVVVLQEKRGGDTLWVVNSHFDHVGKTARLHAAELIVQTLAPALARGRKALFMGDLNAQPDEPPVVFLQKHLTDACPPAQSGEGTFNGFDVQSTQFKRIDYVWYSPGNWTVQHYEVPRPRTAAGRQVSDHFPVLVRFD